MHELIKKYLKPQENKVTFITSFNVSDNTSIEDAIELLETSMHTWERTAKKHIDHLKGIKHEKMCVTCKYELPS